MSYLPWIKLFKTYPETAVLKMKNAVFEYMRKLGKIAKLCVVFKKCDIIFFNEKNIFSIFVNFNTC